MLPYVYGFEGEGALHGDPKYEITAAYPSISKYFGILMGPVFAFSYSVTGIFMGILTDRIDRKKLLLITFSLASLTQVISGSVNSFAILMIMKFFQGILASSTDPATFSLASSYFPEQMRGTMNSVLTAAGYLGAGIASLNVPLVKSQGWRFTLNFCGYAGLILSALSLFILKEPRVEEDSSRKVRGVTFKQLMAKFRSSLRGVLKNPVSKWITFGQCLRFSVPYYFLPAYFLGIYPHFSNQFGLVYGAITLIGGVLSSLLGGLLGDKLSQKTPMGNAWVLLGGAALGLPFFIGSVMLTNSFWPCLVLLGLKTFLGENWFAPSMTMV